MCFLLLFALHKQNGKKIIREKLSVGTTVILSKASEHEIIVLSSQLQLAKQVSLRQLILSSFPDSERLKLPCTELDLCWL